MSLPIFHYSARSILCACLCAPLMTLASPPEIIDDTLFKEIGNDVSVTFTLRDKGFSNPFGATADGGACCVTIKLMEDDLVFDELLGTQIITLSKNDMITGGGGWTSTKAITLIFANASSNYTWYGDDYYITADYTPCVPETQSMAMAAAGLLCLGFVGAVRRRPMQKIQPVPRIALPYHE